jgi:hypothetical protein
MKSLAPQILPVESRLLLLPTLMQTHIILPKNEGGLGRQSFPEGGVKSQETYFQALNPNQGTSNICLAWF